MIIARTTGSASFVIIFPFNMKKKVEEFAEKILEVFFEPIIIEGNSISININIGICFSNDIKNTDTFLKNSKTALQEAIKKGRNKYAVYDIEMSKNIKKQMQLESDIRDAFNKKEFIVFYQPKTDIEGNIIGYEALSRWKRNEEIIFPGVFIKKIEDMGQINQLFNIVFENVCRDIKNNKKRINNVSINISPLQLNDKSLSSNVKKTIKYYNIDPSEIKFEFVETTLIDKNYINVIKELHDYGFKMSIDDFGTGYAKYESILYLFDEKIIDELKIDRIFISNIQSYAYLTFINSITQMAKKFGVNVVVEGVENIQQFFILKNISKELIIQGWLLCKAIPFDDIIKLPMDSLKSKLSNLIIESLKMTQKN